MKTHWILLAFTLAWLGCSSGTPAATNPAASMSAGSVAASAAGTQASVPASGAGATSVAGSGAAGRIGSAGAAPTIAGSGGAGAIMNAGAAPVAAGGGGGNVPQAGQSGLAGATAMAGASAAGSGGTAGTAGTSGAALEHFSFFVASLAGMQRLAGKSEGFGGDLRYGQPDGLSGADKICSDLAESSMPGSAAKGWRAFLSVAQGPGGGAVHAIDRIGEGPWYDRLGRTLAKNKAALLNSRPMGADPAIIDDLPNEDGIPNQTPDPTMPPVNNHHVLTGSDASGKLYNNSVDSTCSNWTTTAKTAGRPRIGFSYPAGNRQHWISGQDEGGCGAGAVLVDEGGSDPSNPIVGSGGGYGAIYCFALMP